MNLAIKFLASVFFLLTLSLSGNIYAQGAKATSAVELARKADALKPGEWVWAPRIAPSGPISVYVDLSRQIATVYRNGVRIGVSTVSSGKKGHETPTGVFTILQKDAKHRSSKYNNAPMPFTERLTWDGVALHAGGLPGYPESHGCVHLPLEFSRLLFDASHLGMTVVVAGRAGDPPIHQIGGVLAPFGDKETVNSHLVLRPDETYRCFTTVDPDQFTMQQFSSCMNDMPIGAIRASSGIATNQADIERLINFMAGFVDFVPETDHLWRMPQVAGL